MAAQLVRHQKSSLAVLPILRGGILRVTLTLGAIAATLFIAGTAFAQVQTPTPPKRSEILRALPITKFYDTPHVLPAGKPGELIRSEPFDDYELPLSVSAIRILYHSRSATGEDVATSGIVLIPHGKNPPARGWPVIAWAHGANGTARSCAPSLMRNIGHGPFLSMYVNLGYAVVATDYTGLGTNYRNAFLDGPSNATDVIHSIPAARAAVPQLGARWIAMGEAEGGLTSVAVAEQENEIRDPGYLGSIVISGLLDAKEIYETSAAGSSSLTSLAFGIETVYPQFQVADMLTEKALALYHHPNKGCSESDPGLSANEMLRSGWEKNEFVRQYFVRNSLGQTRAYGPVLAISRDADQAVAATMTAQAIARMCGQGDRVEWERYPEVARGRVIGDSVRDQIGWIEARFAGRPARSNCP